MSKNTGIEIFDEASLAANRDGYMTKAQRKRVDAIRGDARFIQAIIIPVALFLILIFAVNPIILLSCGFGIGLYAAVILVVSFYDNQSANRDLYKGLVESVEGVVSFKKFSWLNYRITIKDQQFRVSKAVYQHIQNQAQKYFRVYYAPYSNTLLSIEQPGMPSDVSRIADSSELSDTRISLETHENDRQSING